MQAELKKQIIQGLISKGVLVGEDILNRLESIENTDVLSRIKEDTSIILDDNFLEDISSEATQEEEPKNVEYENKEKRKVEVVWSYDNPPKKRNYNDFVSLFNNRYKALLRILRQRQELQNIVSISRLKGKSEREPVAVVGMIQDISETVNNNIILTLEDDTGTIKALVSKNSQQNDLSRVSRNLVLDEVIGVTGTMGDNIIFINNILFPDIPLSKEFKKSPEEEYAVFIGDLHMGSRFFLYKEFEKFKKWLNGEIGNEAQKKMTRKIKYLFITGDMVEGVGIYPEQDKDLDIKDIYEQYDAFLDFVNNIPSSISIIIGPGNHDASRIAEPQPPIDKNFCHQLYEKENVFMVGSPSIINIGATEKFSGIDVLNYHGYSFTYYADAVPYIRDKGGQERVDLIMKFLLQRRHLAPTHGSTLYIPEAMEDPLVISRIPDIFISGHIHRATYSTYKNVSLINTSTWVGITDYQEKLGLKPQPAKVVIANLHTREMRLLNFEDKKTDEKTSTRPENEGGDSKEAEKEKIHEKEKMAENYATVKND